MKLFLKNKQKSVTKIESFLSHINIPKLSEDKAKLSEEDLTRKDLYDSLKILQSEKSAGNDGLTKNFYETFWNEQKEIFIESVSQTKEKGHLIHLKAGYQ